MFNRERLRALADQAKAAGNLWASTAQASLAHAQKNLAQPRGHDPGSGGQEMMSDTLGAGRGGWGPEHCVLANMVTTVQPAPVAAPL